MTYAPGSSDDPNWSWYWEEVAKDGDWIRQHDPSVSMTDPQCHAVASMTDRVEATAMTGNMAAQRDVRRMLSWLAGRLRVVLSTQMRREREGCRSLSAHAEHGIPQRTWATRYETGITILAALAPVWESMPVRQRTLGATLRRVHRPDILTAYVNCHSSLGAAQALGMSQSSVYPHLVRMAQTEPLLKVLMDWRSVDRTQRQEPPPKTATKNRRAVTRPQLSMVSEPHMATPMAMRKYMNTKVGGKKKMSPTMGPHPISPRSSELGLG